MQVYKVTISYDDEYFQTCYDEIIFSSRSLACQYIKNKVKNIYGIGLKLLDAFEKSDDSSVGIGGSIVLNKKKFPCYAEIRVFHVNDFCDVKG